MVIQMINVGENTGTLDQMLIKVADFYEAEVEAVVAGLSKLIEPVVLVVLGGIVAFILVAMYLPVFNIAGTQQGDDLVRSQRRTRRELETHSCFGGRPMLIRLALGQSTS